MNSSWHRQVVQTTWRSVKVIEKCFLNSHASKTCGHMKGFTLSLTLRVHNRVLRSRLPAHFSLLIPPFRPSLRRNPDPAVIFNKVILIKIKTYLYTMGSKYGTITIRKHALMVFLNTQSRFLMFAFKLFSDFEELRFHFPYWHVPKLRISLLCSFISIFH